MKNSSVKQTLISIVVSNLINRANHLASIKAPEALIERVQDDINKLNSCKIKVGGLARKYKIANEEVLATNSIATKGSYYGKGKKDTIVYKIVTTSGTYFYDYYSNQLGTLSSNDVTDLSIDCKVLKSL